MTNNRIDVLEKVLGNAKYVNDLRFPDALHGAVVRCPYPHVRVISIDDSAAKCAEGVAAVVSAKDIPGIPCQPTHKPIFAEEAKYLGEGVAMVVAATLEQAREAAKLVRVEYEELSAVTRRRRSSRALPSSSPMVTFCATIRQEREMWRPALPPPTTF